MSSAFRCLLGTICLGVALGSTGTICLGVALNNDFGGESIPVAIQMAVDDVNDSPVLLAGYRLELVGLHWTVCRQISACSRLVGEFILPKARDMLAAPWSGLYADSNCSQVEIAALIGTESSSTGAAVLPFMQSYGMVAVSGSATSLKLDKQTEFPNFLRTAPSVSSIVNATANFLVSQQLATKVSILFSDDVFCNPGANLVEKLLVTKHSSRVKNFEFPSNTADNIDVIVQHLQTIRDSDTRTIVHCAYADDTRKILAEMNRKGMDTAGWVWISLFDEFNSARSWDDSEIAAFEGFLWFESHVTTSKEFQNRVLAAPSTFQGTVWDGFYYDAVQVVAAALDRANITSALTSGRFSKQDRGLLLSTLRGTVNLAGATGIISGSAETNQLHPKPTLALKNFAAGQFRTAATYLDGFQYNSDTPIVWPGATTVRPAQYECPRGSHYNAEERWNCIECPRGSFQDEPGQGRCRSCPKNKVSERGASSLEKCYCVHGTYASANHTAHHPCQECPPYGLCYGGSLLPTCYPGYFLVLNAKSGLFECVKCNVPRACDPLGLFETNTSSNSTCNFTMENSTSCTCGHQGMLCEKCIDGYRMRDGICRECSSSRVQRNAYWTIAGVIIASITVYSVLLYNFNNPRMGASMSHGAEHAQMIMIISKLPFAAPLSLELLFQWADYTGANAESALANSPSFCVVDSSWFSYRGRFWIIFGCNATLFCGLATVGLLLRFARRCSKTLGWSNLMLQRRLIQGLFVVGLLGFPPLFQHGCDLFSFRMIGSTSRLLMDLDVEAFSAEWQLLLPWSVLSLSLSLCILVFQLVYFIFIICRDGIDALFNSDEKYTPCISACTVHSAGERGRSSSRPRGYFRTLGALYGHSKRKTLPVLWFLMRYYKRALAIIITMLGSFDGNTRSIYLMLLLSCYISLLLSVQPFAMWGHLQKSEDEGGGSRKMKNLQKREDEGEGSCKMRKRPVSTFGPEYENQFGKPMVRSGTQWQVQEMRHQTSKRYRAVEIFSCVAQALTVCMVLSRNNDQHDVFSLDAVVGVVGCANGGFILLLLWSFYQDKLMEWAAQKRAREIWSDLRGRVISIVRRRKETVKSATIRAFSSEGDASFGSPSSGDQGIGSGSLALRLSVVGGFAQADQRRRSSMVFSSSDELDSHGIDSIFDGFAADSDQPPQHPGSGADEEGGIEMQSMENAEGEEKGTDYGILQLRNNPVGSRRSVLASV